MRRLFLLGILTACEAAPNPEGRDAPPALEPEPCQTRNYWLDEDGDGFGAGAAVAFCEKPDRYVGRGSDCDDGDPGVFPGALESCEDRRDKDCDGVAASNPIDGHTWYPDRDRDGFGTEDGSTYTCAQPPGFVRDAGDCDDQAPLTFPGAVEAVCAPVDQDCDGRVVVVRSELGGYVSLDEAFEAESGGSMSLRVCPGVYPIRATVAGDLTLDVEGVGVVLRGVPGSRILDVGGDVRIEGVTFEGWSITGDGGALRAAGNAELRQCTFRDGVATGSGGAVWVGGTDPVLVSDLFFENVTAGVDGGALATPGQVIGDRIAATRVSAGRDGGVLVAKSLRVDEVVAEEVAAGRDGGFALAQVVWLTGIVRDTSAGRHGGLASGKSVEFDGEATNGAAGEDGGFLRGESVSSSANLAGGSARRGGAVFSTDYPRLNGLLTSNDAAEGAAVWAGVAGSTSIAVDLENNTGSPAYFIEKVGSRPDELRVIGRIRNNPDGGLDVPTGQVLLVYDIPSSNGPFDIRWGGARPFTFPSSAGATWTCADPACTVDEE